jgi:hypothetical protein
MRGKTRSMRGAGGQFVTGAEGAEDFVAAPSVVASTPRW